MKKKEFIKEFKMDRKLLKQIINPIDSYSKSVDCDISYVKPFLEALSFDTHFDMIPAYQRKAIIIKSCTK